MMQRAGLSPDLILLDLMLPDIDGLVLCSLLKSISDVPIIICTGSARRADPVLAGVFVHEAFGHLSEADHIYEDERMREIMTLGRTFGQQHLNIVDGAALPGLRGSYAYDDDGVPAFRVNDFVGRHGIPTR